MTHKIRILVAEDHMVARVGVTTVVNTQRDMMVVAQAADGKRAVELYRKHLPDVALLDLRMPILSGEEAAIAIRADFPAARLIALTTYGGDADIRKAIKSGVMAYLTKDVSHKELLKAIRMVYAGETCLPFTAPASSGNGGSLQRPKAELTTREMQVLELIVRGLVNKQIAYSLNLAEYTVKNYVKNILTKLEALDRTHAATEAIRRGIIHLS